MKNILLSLVVFLAVCLNGFSQTVVDLGWDWSGTEAVAPTSGTYLEGPDHNSTGASFTVYPGSENEMSVSCTGDYTYFKYWAGDVYAAEQTFGCLQVSWLKPTDFVEVSLTANSSQKIISEAKLNGTSSELTAGTNFVILYSDAAPFNEQRVISYNDTYSFPEARNGGTGVTLEVPEGCKSFRIYRKVLIEQTSVDPVLYAIDDFGFTVLTDKVENEKHHTRIAYVSLTLENDSPTNIIIPTDGNKAIRSIEYFDITGQKVSSDFKGLVIVKTIYEDGSFDVEKLLSK